jgi:two-component system, cell cycle sensor histidine kinase and response regulator CckA
MAMQDVSESRKPVDRSDRGGSIGMVLAVALLLVGSVVAFLFVGRSHAQPYVLALLSALAVIGVFALFAGAAGIMRLSAKDTGEAFLGSLANGAPDGIVVTDQAGRVVYANSAYLKLSDAVDADDVRPVERVFVGDPSVSEAIYRLVKAAREGKRRPEEVRVPGAEGTPAKYLRLRVRPLDEKGPYARWTVWTVADVTHERDRQEKTFRHLQKAVDDFDHAPAGIFSAGAQGEVVYLNATLADWLDYDLAHVGSGGLKLADIVAGDGAALLTAVAGEPGEVKIEAHDLDLKTRTGKTLPVLVYHKVAFAADGTPGPSRMVVLNRASAAGADPGSAAEARFSRFFHNTPMAIATVDKAGRIARANAPFASLQHGLIKGDVAPVEGRSIFAIVADDGRPALEAAIVRAAEGHGEIKPVDADLIGGDRKLTGADRAAGGQRSARFYVSAVPENERDGEAVIVYALETTEQRALQEQFAQSHKMEAVGQLAGGIAHDFNNALSAIMMATDFLVQAHRPTDPSFGDIIQIKQSANRAKSLVRHLMAFSRKQTLRPEVIDLSEVLEEITTMQRRVIGERIKFETMHGRDLWPVKVDQSQLEQVIVNLLVNARDAMPEGGKLTVRTQNVTKEESAKLPYKPMPPADYVLIEVADTGSGIPPEIREKIFEPFFTTKEHGKGTGLGLSTVYGIIKQTNGFVFVDDPASGTGAVFRIYLPRHMGPVEKVGVVTQKPVADLTGTGTILLVEDEPDVRSLNSRALTQRGYTVLSAANGREALEVFEGQNGAIDLVVSDVMMPEMDGPTLAKELRSRNPGLKIIFVSGYAEDALDKDLSDTTFLSKPLSLKQLVAAVKETMAA